jgi:2-polyprenyl-3-methyl-5-hydroxy-6-metoxy-1,4-benzoquinol methylase
MQPEQYSALLAQEGQTWGEAARDLSRRVKPDWQEVKRLPHHVILHGRHIERLLSLIQPGWRVLEIGCSSGWLSLEMARRGAHVEGIDVAESAIEIAREYAAENPPSGSVEYAVADINYMPLPEGKHDLIVAIGVLHHLVEVEDVLDRVRKALRPSGLLFVSDALDTPRANALVAGALLMLLPTRLGYREKFSHLFRLRGQAVAHLRDSIEAKGLSPFEGYGRHQQPEARIQQKYNVKEVQYESAFVGYIIAQLNLPDRGIITVGRVLSWFDNALVKLHLLPGLNYVLTATPQR